MQLFLSLNSSQRGTDKPGKKKSLDDVIMLGQFLPLKRKNQISLFTEEEKRTGDKVSSCQKSPQEQGADEIPAQRFHKNTVQS